MVVPKPRQEWDELDKRKAQLNAKFIYFIHYSIDRNEYNCVCQCESAKDI